MTLFEHNFYEPIYYPQVLDCVRMHPDAKLPTTSEDNIGHDLYCVEDEEFKNGEIELAPISNRELLRSLTNAINNSLFDEFDAAILLEKLDKRHSHIFHTGIAAKVPTGYAALLWDRSGMGAKRNIHRLAGVIDSSYTGEWLVSLINLSNEPQVIKAGDKIVQFIIQKEYKVFPQWVDSLEETERGSKGFGSSGA